MNPGVATKRGLGKARLEAGGNEGEMLLRYQLLLLLNLSSGQPRVERNFANFRRNSAVADRGKPMARNFGLPMRSARHQPGAFWPLLPLAFIVVGLMSAVAHLR